MNRIITTILLTALLTTGGAVAANASVVPTGQTWMSTTCKIGSARNQSGVVTYKGASCVIEPLDIDAIPTLGFRYRDAAGHQHTLHSSARIWALVTAHGHGSKCKDVNASGCYTPRSIFTRRHAVVYRDGMSVDTVRFH